jgi:hypothetical protein
MATETGARAPRATAGVVLDAVSHAYGDVRALERVSLRAGAG